MKHFIAALFCLLPFSALAQEAPRSILVLDASGSMWGQIDGVAKIDIAREVIIDLLQSLPAEQELGLTVYGHRRKGDCGDIETIIAPGPNTREAIAEAVRAISPRGKTPLSAAVLQAAEALRYTEERATVILVSDGRETCAGDNPQLTCEMGRRLEETGVDITVHVVGFDVFDIADQAELQCLADETGGIFLTAANASELSQALLVVTEPPAPVEVRIDLRAIEGPSGPEISSGISWQLAALNSSATLSDATSPRPTTELLPGTEATVIVTRAKDGATVSHSFTVKTAGQLITLVLPELPPEPSTVSFVAREGNNRGPIITGLLVWDLYSGDGTAIGQTRSSASGIANELLPGSYRIEVLRPEDEASATATFVVNEATLLVTMILPELIAAADIQAPDSAVAGSKIPVAWTGPGDPNDYITVADPGAPPTSNYQYSYTRETTVLLRMPPAAGTYELRYIDRLTRRILARRPITITPVSVTLEAPAEATAGANAMITWVGPDYQGDYLSVAEIGTGDSSSINYSYTKYGSPLQLQMPTKPGTYELRYVMQISRTVVARRNITVTDLATTVNGPASGPGGST
ncbi:MAG: VWA domain-containing protein, partial [Halocynthiibacter sp.]